MRTLHSRSGIISIAIKLPFVAEFPSVRVLTITPPCVRVSTVLIKLFLVMVWCCWIISLAG